MEFLLVFVSQKKIGESPRGWEQSFPDREAFVDWPANETLKYYPKARLGLKLFSFLGSSNLETRHDCHREHFSHITEKLSSRLQIETSALKTEDILSFLEEMLIGFVGVAQNRTWCAHSFLPVNSGFLARETIWRKKGRNHRNAEITWNDGLKDGHFSFADRAFLARGGELLFLQLCNFFRRAASDEILGLEKRLNHEAGTGATLQGGIERGLKAYLNSVPALNRLTEWIEGVDQETEKEIAERRHEANCGLVPGRILAGRIPVRV